MRNFLSFARAGEPLPRSVALQLAILDSLLDIFHDDAYAKYPHLRRSRPRSGRSHAKKNVSDSITAHVTTLLNVYLALSDSGGQSPVSVNYDMELDKLLKKAAARRANLTGQAPGWTRAQLCRHILKANKNFKPYSHMFPLEQLAGVNDSLIKIAKRLRLREYLLSTLWMIAVEAPQLITGWVGGILERWLIDTKSLLTIGILAASTRLASTAMLARKGYLAEKIVEQTGVAPDPFSKACKEKWGKAWPGFTAYNGIFELVFTLNSALGIPILGWPGAFAIETATNLSPMGIPRQLFELVKMEEQLAIWGAARRTVHAAKIVRDFIVKGGTRKPSVTPSAPAETLGPVPFSAPPEQRPR